MTTLPSEPEITPTALAAALESGAPLHVVDVRAPERLTTAQIETAPPARFHNLIGSSLLARSSLNGTGLDDGAPIVTVCGHGTSSLHVARHLNHLGAHARSLAGGMAAWMNLVVPRALSAPPGFDHFVQLDRLGKGALGYVLISAGEALIVDPPRDARCYLDVVRDANARVAAVADTHVHADYLSGTARLASELGVPYHVHPLDAASPYDGAPARFMYRPLRDGESLRLGGGEIGVRHTPGHTAGSVTFMLGDAAALTGDFVFVNGVGRPDLGGRAGEWTLDLWASLAAAKRAWPATLEIYPAHYASAAERASNRAVHAPFGQLVERQEPLRIAERDEFVRWVERHRTEFPESYRTMKLANLGLVTVDDDEAELLEVGRNQCALG